MTWNIINTTTGSFSWVDIVLSNNQAAISFTWVERDASITITQSTWNFVSWDSISYVVNYLYTGSISMTWSIFLSIPSNVVLQSSSISWVVTSSWILRTWLVMNAWMTWTIILTGTVFGTSWDIFMTTWFIGDDVYCLPHYLVSWDAIWCLETDLWNNIVYAVGNVLPTTHDISVMITWVQHIWWGYPLSYTISVTNNGPNTWYNINLDIQKTWPLQINTPSLMISTLGVGDTFYYTLTGRVSTWVATWTLYSITAISSSSWVDPLPTNNTALFSGTISNYIYGFAWWGGYEPSISNNSNSGSWVMNSGTINSEIVIISEKDIFNWDIQNTLCYTRKVWWFTGSDLAGPYNSIQEAEFPSALIMLYSYGLTQYNTIAAFGDENILTREQAAKMFSQFAINILCRQPNQAQPVYKDYDTADSTLKSYITLAYQLGLMHGNPQSWLFRPQDPITKQEFTAVLVRMLLAKYLPESNTENWSSNYDNIAQKLNLITRWSTYFIRHDAALMFFRAYKNQNYVDTDIWYVLQNK